jgi:hypothetical protein
MRQYYYNKFWMEMTSTFIEGFNLYVRFEVLTVVKMVMFF